MTAPTVALISVAVTKDIVHAFEDIEIVGKGGFQSLCEEIRQRVLAGSPVVHFTRQEFRAIVRYATAYGDGGYQQRLRVLVAHWTAQHFDELMAG